MNTSTSKVLQIPLGDSVAFIPFPMTDQDYRLMMDTIDLWRMRLVPSRAIYDEAIERTKNPALSVTQIAEIWREARDKIGITDIELGLMAREKFEFHDCTPAQPRANA